MTLSCSRSDRTWFRSSLSALAVSALTAGVLGVGPAAHASAATAAPTAAASAESLSLVDKTEPIGPGISLRSLTSVTPKG